MEGGREGDARSGAEDGTSSRASETRGQMLQRHKRELKACKDAAKRLGKKRKDEASKVEEEMKARHAREILEMEAKEPVSKELETLTQSVSAVSVGSEGTKMTKARRRREKRAGEEMERERRIEQELEEMGETDQQAEESLLLSKLDPLGLRMKQMQADGHCMFRAIEDQLRSLGKESDFMSLRKEAADYMRWNSMDFSPFVADVIANGDGTPEGAFEAYCMEIETTASWGGQLELQALSRALKVPIEVYSATLPLVELGAEHKKDHPPLRVAYLQHAYGLGQHYNSVVESSWTNGIVHTIE